MTDLFNNLASYLHDVFVIKFDGWVILGFVAQAFFTMRFVVQWIASERARKSVIPMAFWFFSIGGGVLLLVYALYRRDPVFIAGQALGHRRLYSQFVFHYRQRPAGVGQRLIARRRGSYAALKASNPRSRSALRSETFSSPM